MTRKYLLIFLLPFIGSGTVSGDGQRGGFIIDCVSLSAGARNDASEIVNLGQIVVGRYTQGPYTVELGVIPCLSAEPAEGCPFNCADINGSGGLIDLVDFAAFSVCFGLSPSTSVECLCSDIDGSGGPIDLVYFAAFSLLFGLNSTASCP